MEANATGDVLRIFDQVVDPRGCNAIHRLSDLMAIAILAVICGADGWVQVALFGESKIKWLSTFLELPGGIPATTRSGGSLGCSIPIRWRSASSPGPGRWPRAGS
jgi:hypothetical protein